jgi:type II secretory pathway component PulK
MKRALSPRGSALMVVMWALLVLTAAVLAWARWIQLDIQLNGNANRGSEALAMAHSGVSVAMATLGSGERPPILEEELGTALGFRVRTLPEGGKLNLSWLLDANPPQLKPVKMMILKSWLSMRGFNYRESDIFVDCLIDWTDADNLRQLNGAEEEANYHPPNRPLQSLDEVLQVRGSDPLRRSPGWQDQVTLTMPGQSPLLNLMAAPAPILRMIPGLDENRIQRLLAYRAGKDKVEGTADDPDALGKVDAYGIMGFTQAQLQQLRQITTDQTQAVRILADGHSGKVVRQVEVVARKSGGYPQILSWKE